MHSRWVKPSISSVIACRLTVANPLGIVNNNLRKHVCMDSVSCRRGFQGAPHTCLWRHVTGLSSHSSPLLTDKKGNHFTFDLVFMSASFIYLFILINASLFRAAAAGLHGGDLQMTSLLDTTGLLCRLKLTNCWVQSPIMERNYNLERNVIPFPISRSPLRCSIHQGWRNYPPIVVKCDGNGKSQRSRCVLRLGANTKSWI